MALKRFGNCAAVLLFGVALFQSGTFAASSPVQIVTTGMPGVGTDTPNVLLVALPIQNIGTATAEDIKVTSVNLVSAPLLAPSAFPVFLGNLATNAILPVNAQFDRSALAPGNHYRMTVSGTYQAGGVVYGFSVSRNITLPSASPGSSTLGSTTITSVVITNPANLPVPVSLPEDEEEGRNPPGPPVPIGKEQVIDPGAFATGLTGGGQFAVRGAEPHPQRVAGLAADPPLDDAVRNGVHDRPFCPIRSRVQLQHG